MTDDQMDDRLRAAGDRWRAANTAVADVPERTDEIEILPAARRGKPMHYQRWITAASAAVVAAALVVGGALVTRTSDHSNQTRAAAAKLTGTTWSLPGVNGSTLRFDPSGTVTGNDGCNTVQGTAKVQGNKISFAVGGTEMYCPGALIAKTDRILSGTVTWSIAGDTLTLTKQGVGSLSYRNASALLGTTWQLIGIQYGTGYYRNQTQPTMPSQLEMTTTKFTTTRRCYSTRGDVVVHDATITMSNGQLYREHSCPALPPSAGNGDQDDAIDAILDGTLGWSIQDGRLTLTNHGVGTLVYGLDEPAIADPAQLVGHSWRLTQTETDSGGGNSGSASGSSAVGTSKLVFDGKGGFTLTHYCTTVTGDAELAAGSAVLTKVTSTFRDACSAATESVDSVREDHFVDSVLTGRVTWSITGTELTITKGNDTLTFTTS